MAFEFKFGNKAFADANPKIGKPLDDELYITPNTSIQFAEGGVLYYSKTDNTTRCLPSGAPGK